MPTKTSKTKINPTTAGLQKATLELVAQPVTTSSPVKRRKRQTVKVLLEADDIARDQVGGFITFLREHAIVGLAVGFVIGQQAQGVIKQLVTSFIDPFIQLLTGGHLSELKVSAHLFGNTAEFAWGGMINVLVNLLVVLATIYILIKLLKLDKVDTPKKDKSVDKTTDNLAAKKRKKSNLAANKLVKKTTNIDNTQA